jgi:hypothetical protein
MTTLANRRSSVLSLLTLAAITAVPALGQVYQRTDTVPVTPAGVNGRTNLLAVAGTPDGGYIAVGSDGPNYLHLARYDGSANVTWSRYSPMAFNFAQVTSINPIGTAANQAYVVAGEIADAYPWGTFVAMIDGAGNLMCPIREINGVGPSATTSRSPVAVKPLNDQSYVVTGRSQQASTAPVFGRLTRFAPGCGGAVMWSRIYTPTGGVEGLTGACEITDVVEEPNNETLLAVGTAAVANAAAVPFLLRVDRANGNVLQAAFYGNGNPAVNLRGDGLALSFDSNNVHNGYVFDGRSTPTNTGGGSTTSNYVVRVDNALNLVWAETFREFEPCHAGVRTHRDGVVLAGTRNSLNSPAANVWIEYIKTVDGSPVWGWNYGRQNNERGNGIALTTATAANPTMGPIVVGVRNTATAPGGGFLVKANIVDGDSGGCQEPAPVPFTGGVRLQATFAATFVQNLRTLDNPLVVEQLDTLNACLQLCCNQDFNNDGDIGTDADIEAFFACLGGDCCPTCGTSDFNCDGDFGTDADIESFFSVLAGGPC